MKSKSKAVIDDRESLLDIPRFGKISQGEYLHSESRHYSYFQLIMWKIEN